MSQIGEQIVVDATNQAVAQTLLSSASALVKGAVAKTVLAGTAVAGVTYGSSVLLDHMAPSVLAVEDKTSKFYSGSKHNDLGPEALSLELKMISEGTDYPICPERFLLQWRNNDIVRASHANIIAVAVTSDDQQVSWLLSTRYGLRGDTAVCQQSTTFKSVEGFDVKRMRFEHHEWSAEKPDPIVTAGDWFDLMSHDTSGTTFTVKEDGRKLSAAVSIRPQSRKKEASQIKAPNHSAFIKDCRSEARINSALACSILWTFRAMQDATIYSHGPYYRKKVEVQFLDDRLLRLSSYRNTPLDDIGIEDIGSLMRPVSKHSASKALWSNIQFSTRTGLYSVEALIRHEVVGGMVCQDGPEDGYCSYPYRIHFTLENFEACRAYVKNTGTGYASIDPCKITGIVYEPE